jgi:hypothetical protein
MSFLAKRTKEETALYLAVLFGDPRLQTVRGARPVSFMITRAKSILGPAIASAGHHIPSKALALGIAVVLGT